jgi:ribosomal protein S18 acetylase RimI-like enzyme
MRELNFIPFKEIKINNIIYLYNEVYKDYIFTANHDLDSFAIYKKELPMSDEFSYVVTCMGKPIGIAIVAINNQRAWISAFGLIKEYRHKGYGRELLNHVVKELKAKRAKDIGLEVLNTNVGAKKLYLNYGFKKVANINTFSGSFIAGPQSYIIKDVLYQDIKEIVNNDLDYVWDRRVESLVANNNSWAGLYIKREIRCLFCYEIGHWLSIKRVKLLSGDVDDIRRLYCSISADKRFPKKTLMVNYFDEEKVVTDIAKEYGLKNILTQNYLKLGLN